MGSRLLDGLRQDLRDARRLLAASPGLCLAVVVCLTLGIGINAGVFNLFNAMVLRELPVRAPERLVSLWRTETVSNGSILDGLSWGDFLQLRERVTTLSGVAATTPPWPAIVRFDDKMARGGASLVSSDYFEVLGIEPADGRFLLPSETSIPGQGSVAVVSHDFWLQDLGGVDAIGSSITVNGVDLTIVGVGPAGFRGHVTEYPAGLWLPITLADALYPQFGASNGGTFERRDLAWTFPVGRLSEGTSIAAVQAELDALGAALAKGTPEAEQAGRISVYSEIRRYPRETETLRGWATFAMVITGSILLIACANVTSLLLAHSMTRQRELAVRLALGCSRARLVRQLLVEAAALAGLAAVAALLLLVWSHELLVQLMPYYRSDEVPSTPDLTVVLFVVGISAAVVPFATLGTVSRFTRAHLWGALRGVPGSGAPQQNLQRALAIAQVSVSVAVLIAAALLSRSLLKLWATDPGFEAKGLVIVSVESLSLSGYDEPTARVLYSELLDGLEATPGITTAVLAEGAPSSGAFEVPVTSATAAPVDPAHPAPQESWLHFSGTGFFQAAGIPLVSGRDLVDPLALVAGAAAEVVVNETLARQLGLTSADLGRELSVGRHPQFAGGHWRAVVVGIARDTVNGRPGRRTQPTLWAGWSTHPGALMSFAPTLLIRVASDSDERAVASIRDRVETLAPEIHVRRIQTGPQWMDLFAVTERKAVWFAGGFAMLALTLATLGTYATIRQAIQERQRDLGVRLALGATPGQIAGLVIRDGMRLAGWGIVLGTGFALGGGRYLASQLHGISTYDPLSVLAGIVITLSVVVTATLLPARRAANTDPMTVIRHS